MFSIYYASTEKKLPFLEQYIFLKKYFPDVKYDKILLYCLENYGCLFYKNKAHKAFLKNLSKPENSSQTQKYTIELLSDHSGQYVQVFTEVSANAVCFSGAIQIKKCY